MLITYEYIITFGREVELYWRRGITGAAILFYFNRYITLLAIVYGYFESMPVSDSVRGRSPTLLYCEFDAFLTL